MLLAIVCVALASEADKDVQESSAQLSHQNLQQVKQEIATIQGTEGKKNADSDGEPKNQVEESSGSNETDQVSNETSEVNTQPQTVAGTESNQTSPEVGSRPLILMQQVVRIKERLVVDEQNRPKAFGGEIIKSIYRSIDGHWQRLGQYRLIVRPRPVIGPDSANNTEAQAQNEEKDMDLDPKDKEKIHGTESMAMGFFVTICILVAVFLVASLIVIGVDKWEQKKKREQEYKKLLQVPTSEHMAANAPTAPSYH
jgi:hypothetical protein